ncbi:tyrosine--tRNA ligase [Gammaproteobacteria bacterium]|mgnify:FL=1|nr:tyrosine--tRNA ligase [Gammaproteobacteria bacterium]MDB3976206.1 tyrosine--tRNA ligase [Gammaproteobacteria bacterium]MDC0545304.1 tyrosine--tRNA ligase [Gammaproteobacteria bacterium]MDC0577784.1 tyrosine--tRNA ligase [Gammaproteobacteria bacterium]
MSKESLELLTRGTEEIIPEEAFLEQIDSKRTLRIKAGFDPTSPDLHLGHTVLLNKMKIFQDLGHEVIFLIGDFTGLVGDPSGVNETRPVLTEEQLNKNAETYKQQVFKILDPDKTEIRYNSEWMNEVHPSEFIKLLSSYTVARMLERDDFSKRYKAQQPISIHEFLYPILQGYDSVKLNADIEMGGTDQKFNLLLGREVQKHYGQKQQSILTVPLLEGLDGVKKMSKSLGNYIALEDKPDDMFGKLMSISDDLMWRYFSLLSFRSSKEILVFKNDINEGTNPRDIKFLLAEEIVERFHKGLGEVSKGNFINRFQKGNISQDIEEININIENDSELLTRIIKESKLLSSTSEALRMIQQGAVKLNDEKVSDGKTTVQKGSSNLIQVGKKKVAKIFIV